ncbi:hypothetical protein D9M69_706770 [compost metagenome]
MARVLDEIDTRHQLPPPLMLAIEPPHAHRQHAEFCLGAVVLGRRLRTFGSCLAAHLAALAVGFALRTIAPFAHRLQQVAQFCI